MIGTGLGFWGSRPPGVAMVAPKVLDPRLSFTRASAAYGVVDGDLVGFAANTARFVDAPDGGYALIGPEPPRTQLVPYCQTIGGSNWATLTAAGQTMAVTPGRSDPFGETAAVRLASTGDTTRVINTTSPLASGATYALSIWAKSATGANQIFRLLTPGSNQFSTDLTATTQWQRFIVPFTMTAASPNVSITRGSANAAYDIDVYHYQVELGGRATSPIITTSNAPVTRAAENFFASGANFSSLIPNTGNWSMLFEITMGSINDAENYINFFEMTDGIVENRNIIYVHPNSRNLTMESISAGVFAQNHIFASYNDGVKMRLAVTRNAGRIAASFNNGAIISHTNAAGAPSGFNQLTFFGGSFRSFDLIHRAELRPYSLTDAQLQAWV